MRRPSAHYPASMTTRASASRAHRLPRAAGDLHRRGPALRGRPRRGELVACSTITEAIARRRPARSMRAFVPIENSIEGSVNATLDHLVFDDDLLIQREVVLEVHLEPARPARARARPRSAGCSPSRTPAAQCRRYLAANLAGAEVECDELDRGRRPPSSPRTGDASLAAIAPPLAAKLYGLEVLAHAIEDHPGNEHPLRARRPGRRPAADGPRPHDDRLLPAGGPSRQPARHPRPVRGPQAST